MKRSDLVDLVMLGALWGASFLFMRLGAREFGPWTLVFLRVAVASAVLLPLLVWQGQLGALRQHWRPVAAIGLVNTALPFLGFAVAAQVLEAGLMAVFNATAPIWTALIAWAWLGDRLAGLRWLGLAIGLAGAVGLSWERLGFKTAAVAGVTPLVGIGACLAAALFYAIAALLSRRHLQGVPPGVTAAGTQLSAALVLLLPAVLWWPAETPGAVAWLSVLALGAACTGLAYLLYFRLIAHVGATQAVTVTFLIPAFAILWGWLVLGERPSPSMLIGCAVILLGTALATGLVGGRAPTASSESEG